MFIHYITIALRFMSRNTGLTAINIIGFTVGLAAGLMMYLWVDDELHFDDFHYQANQIYRIIQLEKHETGIRKHVYGSPVLGDDLQKVFPQIADYAFIQHGNDYDYYLLGETKISVWPVRVNKDFFSFFGFQFIEGNPKTAFNEPQTLVISEKLAQKLFGNHPALGKELLEASLYSDKKVPYRITGVVRIPHNTHISFDVASVVPENYMDNGVTYLRFDDHAVFNSQTQEDLSRYQMDVKGKNSLLQFQPLKDIHLHTDYNSYYQHDRNKGDIRYVIFFGILSVFIVLMGAFNFMSLSTAQAIKRNKEVAIRKVNGSGIPELIGQFFTETLVQVFLSMLLAVAIVRLCLPYFNSLVSKDIVLIFDFKFWLTSILSLMLVGMVANSYPALYLSSLSPMSIFKGGNQTGTKTGFIRSLIIFQFTLSITLIICTLFVFKQLSYVKNKNLGIDKENIITSRCNLWYDVDEFKQEILRNPAVLSVSMSMLTPESFAFKTNAEWDSKTTQDTILMNMAFVDGDFAETYGLQLVQGEFMNSSKENYWSSKGNPVMINESAARIIGMDNCIGKTLNGNKIAGIVRDFHFKSLKEPISPLILSYNIEALTNLNIKMASGNQSQTIAFIKDTYERMRPGSNFEYQFFDDQIAALYQTENKLSRIFLIFTFLSIFISCLGILGLTALSIKQRTKEIGLRKIAGATVLDIMLLLNKAYIRWIAIAFIIAVPISIAIVHKWLQGFSYRTPLSWWVFLIAGLMAIILAIAVISWLCYTSARQNPVKSLRYE